MPFSIHHLHGSPPENHNIVRSIKHPFLTHCLSQQIANFGTMPLRGAAPISQKKVPKNSLLNHPEKLRLPSYASRKQVAWLVLATMPPQKLRHI